jgi:hypothetical protein
VAGEHISGALRSLRPVLARTAVRLGYLTGARPAPPWRATGDGARPPDDDLAFAAIVAPLRRSLRWRLRTARVVAGPAFVGLPALVMVVACTTVGVSALVVMLADAYGDTAAWHWRPLG